MEEPKQEGRMLKIDTPLGEDFLLIQRVDLYEEISRLPRAECVVLHNEVNPGAEPTPLDVQKILGQTVTLLISTSDGTKRHFHGMVNRCTQMDRDKRFTHYKLEIVPSYWLLTQKQDSRIFQHVTIPKILETVLSDYPVEIQLGTVEWKPRNYVVQYREDDFSFVSRLMEEEGIFYYFTHTEEEHKMIICVDPQSHLECPGKSEVNYKTVIEGENFVPHIGDLVVDFKLLTGKTTLWDHSFQKPTDNFAVTQPSRFKFGQNEKAEQYLFPAGSIKKHDAIDATQGERQAELGNMSSDIKRLAQTIQESIDVRHRIISANSNVCSFTAGHKFKMTTHPSKDFNGNYVLTSVSHSAIQSPPYFADMEDGGYQNKVTCIPWGESSGGVRAVPFRPECVTPKPMILASQTATVVGPEGEEIYTDKYGRVKVQFHWDREGEFDQGSSCWARVAQQWAGNQWGAMFIPRIGMEVLIHFLEGDPDQPIITGCVYNNDAMPPYSLPEEKTKSGIKSDSSLGGQGFNEWRFEDKKGSEQIFIHGEKDRDMRIKNDNREWVGNDQHMIIVSDLLEKVGASHHQAIGENQNVKIGGNHSLDVAGNESIKVSGTQTMDVSGDQGFKSSNHSTEAGQNIYIKAGMKVVIEAGAQLSLKGPGGFIDIGPTGVSITGTMVLINSGGAAGSGSAVGMGSPTAPEEPAVADDSKPGSKMKLEKQSADRKQKKGKEDPNKTSWIEIELVDEAGQPVAGEAFELKAPDGTIRTGTTDNKGKAMVKGIDPGNCEVTFTNLDKGAWKDK